MADKSAPKVVALVDINEDDDVSQYVVERRPSSMEWAEAGTSIADVLHDIEGSHPSPTSSVQPTNPIQPTDVEGSTDDASRALLDLKRGTNRSDVEEMHLTIKKRQKDVSELRPTSSFTAYYEFMHSLVQHMGQRHWEAYEDSVFRHYIHFGPPGLDLPVLRQWDKDKMKFVFTNTKI